jgi:hypothetical protein
MMEIEHTSQKRYEKGITEAITFGMLKIKKAKTAKNWLVEPIRADHHKKEGINSQVNRAFTYYGFFS